MRLCEIEDGVTIERLFEIWCRCLQYLLSEFLSGLGLDGSDCLLSPLRHFIVDSTNGTVDCQTHLVDLSRGKLSTFKASNHILSLSLSSYIKNIAIQCVCMCVRVRACGVCVCVCGVCPMCRGERVYHIQVILGDESIKRDLNVVFMVETLAGGGVIPQTTDGTSVLPLEFISPVGWKQAPL